MITISLSIWLAEHIYILQRVVLLGPIYPLVRHATPFVQKQPIALSKKDMHFEANALRNKTTRPCSIIFWHHACLNPAPQSTLRAPVGSNQ